ncbi:DUF1440 domain-containing protein [Sphaerisporangium perillae]|uniref:DUF1440 domain-containing protein n=1 Tax=Sphaerisporangium perillae TaxID=2935860 RepID=UPI00200BFF4E|nr:DUF1440 domain-containing protein [Sphaerisporangium perillae]
MIHNLVRGAFSGVIATAAMSAVMVAGDRAGLMGEHPPQRIARAALPGPKHRPKPGEGVLGAVAHFGFGAVSGALFAAAVGRREPRPPLGAVYGLAIWAVSYQGWVPGLGILPPIHRDRPGRQAIMAAGHVVYGTALVLALNRLRRGDRTAVRH